MNKAMSVDPKAILQRIESTYGPLAEGVPSVAYVYEPGVNGACLYVSPSIERVLGFTQTDWIRGDGLWDRLLHPEDAERVVTNEAECERSGESLVQEYRIKRADGDYVWIRDEMTVVRGPKGEDKPLFYGVFLDVTDRKRMEAELERLALYDSLTGLPNRALFSDRLQHAIERRGRRETTAVYFLDVDRFKRINDSLGHTAGDEVLREISARIERALRPDDTVARFGGDEFTVLCESVGGVLEAVGVADRLQREISEPLHAGGAELRLSASIGIALAEPGEEVDPSRLVEDADAAMYRAKERGGDRAELFDMRMRERAVEELSIEQELTHGLEHGELRLFYQPLVNLDTGEMVGAEALIRWDHPDRGLLEPHGFLSVAEDSGLIVQVGEWAVGEACRRMREWDRQGEGGPAFGLAVNLSARELTHPDVVATVLNAVRRAGLDPHRLTIEVTESTAMADRDSGFRALRELCEAGVRIAIDDFGTGYSSLDHLREMPADILKIDRSFVAGMAANSPDSALVAAAIAMGRALDMVVVAEGIETSGQVSDLRELGCSLGQGYLFSRPVPAEEFDALLEAGVRF
jgi:diguanylate cyclase (GGDEF)-like protein/PAS domain S-box-containing protein